MSVYGDRKWIPTTGEKLYFPAPTGFATNPQVPNPHNAIAFTPDMRNIILGIVGTGNVKVYGSMQKEKPDFSLPSTINNLYDTVMTADYQAAGVYYTGAAGITVSTSTKQVEINTNLLAWIGIWRDSETVEVKMLIGDNQ